MSSDITLDEIERRAALRELRRDGVPEEELEELRRRGRFTLADLDAAAIRKGLGKARPKGKLPALPDTRDVDTLRAWLTVAFKPEQGWQFDAFVRATTEKTDGCSIAFRKGRETRAYRFKPQSDLMGSKLRSMVLSVSKGELDMPHLTGSEIEDVWAALCKLGAVLTETDEREETTRWMEQILDVASPLRGYTLEPDGKRRHEGLVALREQGEFGHPEARALLNRSDTWFPRPTRFVDRETGEHWLRAGETIAFVRWVCGAEPLSARSLRGRLAEIGVEAKHFQAWDPPHPKAWLYQLTPELVEYAEGREHSAVEEGAEEGGGGEGRGGGLF